jgi:SSS family transporter
MLVAVALHQSRKLNAQDDLFLANRSMSRWPVAISMYTAIFSTNTLLGVIGWLNRPDGTIWIGLQNIGIILAVPLVVALYPNVFFRLRVTTAYEYLEQRFDYPVRVLATILFISSRVMWMATILYGGSLVVSPMIGWEQTPHLAVLLIVLLGTALAITGGMRAVIWTDVAQFCVLFGSTILLATIAIQQSGGIHTVLTTAASADRFRLPPLFSLSGNLSVASGLCLGLVSMLASGGTDQVLLQTYLSSKSVQEARAALWFNGLFLKPLSLVFPAVGVLIFVYFHEHPSAAAQMRVPDDALPVFILHAMPAGARGLAIAGILAAMLTTFQAGLSALAACVQVDYIRRWRSKPMSDAGAVRLGRALMAAWAAIIFVVALGILRLGQNSSIIQILNIVMYPFAGTLLGVFLLGLLTRHISGPPTIIAAMVGLAVTVALPLAGTAVSNFYFGLIAAGTTFVVANLAALLSPSMSPEQTEGLTIFSPRGPS